MCAACDKVRMNELGLSSLECGNQCGKRVYLSEPYRISDGRIFHTACPEKKAAETVIPPPPAGEGEKQVFSLRTGLCMGRSGETFNFHNDKGE